MPDAVLKVGGKNYSGWTSLRMTRGIMQIAGGYQLTVSEKFDVTAKSQAVKPRPIKPGLFASVALGSQTVVQGYIDIVAPNYNATSHSLVVSGRDATGDLADCAAIHKTGTWSNRTMAQIANDLCAPFKVPVKVLANVGAPFPTWSIEPGETVMENLDRMARYRGVLLMSDGLGSLLITQPGQYQAPASLVLGENILAARGHCSMQERFSEYIVKAQQMGGDMLFGSDAAAPSGTATDSTVGRYRPTVIMAEDQANIAGCKLRAAWQRTVAAAKAQSIIYTVRGWEANGKLWQPNALVALNDPFMDLDETRLIAQVDFRLDEGGELTDLTVTGRHAFDPIKLPQPNPTGGLF